MLQMCGACWLLLLRPSEPVHEAPDRAEGMIDLRGEVNDDAPPILLRDDGFPLLKSLWRPNSSESEKAAVIVRLLQIAVEPDEESEVADERCPRRLRVSHHLEP